MTVFATNKTNYQNRKNKNVYILTTYKKK